MILVWIFVGVLVLTVMEIVWERLVNWLMTKMDRKQ